MLKREDGKNNVNTDHCADMEDKGRFDASRVRQRIKTA